MLKENLLTEMVGGRSPTVVVFLQQAVQNLQVIHFGTVPG